MMLRLVKLCAPRPKREHLFIFFFFSLNCIFFFGLSSFFPFLLLCLFQLHSFMCHECRFDLSRNHNHYWTESDKPKTMRRREKNFLNRKPNTEILGRKRQWYESCGQAGFLSVANCSTVVIFYSLSMRASPFLSHFIRLHWQRIAVLNH